MFSNSSAAKKYECADSTSLLQKNLPRTPIMEEELNNIYMSIRDENQRRQYAQSQGRRRTNFVILKKAVANQRASSKAKVDFAKTYDDGFLN